MVTVQCKNSESFYFPNSTTQKFDNHDKQMQEKEDRTKCEKLKSWNLFIVLFLHFNKYWVYPSTAFFRSSYCQRKCNKRFRLLLIIHNYIASALTMFNEVCYSYFLIFITSVYFSDAARGALHSKFMQYSIAWTIFMQYCMKDTILLKLQRKLLYKSWLKISDTLMTHLVSIYRWTYKTLWSAINAQWRDNQTSYFSSNQVRFD